MSRASRMLFSGAAAALVLVVNFLTAWLSRRYPFGDYTRNINDMWHQFIPFHLHLRDLITGTSNSSFSFNWTLGGGTSFAGDYGTYVSSPFSLLVLAFPRDQIELAMWAIVTLKMAAAAAAMVWLLGSLKNGSPWLLTILGASYALCGWALDDASYVPMWLDGLLGLPLISLVALWTLRRQRLVLGAVIVAGVWWSNYYTAYMASIGAATFLLALVLIERQSPRVGLVTMLRFLAQGVLGVLLAGVLLAPTLTAVLGATANTTAVLRPVPWHFFASRMLSGTEGVGRSPSLAVGMLALTLMLGIPWLKDLPRRTRAILCLSTVAVLVSFNFHVTHSIWHLFSSPNGSQFRQAFVGAFWMVVLAWFAATARWSARILLAAGASLSLLALFAAAGTQQFTTKWTWLAFGVTILMLAGAAVATRRRLQSKWPTWSTTLTGALLTVLFVTESVGTYLITQGGQDRFLHFSNTVHSSDLLKEFQVPEQAAWPQARGITVDLPNQNSGAFLGVEGLSYYSSLTPASMSTATQDLGFHQLASGRSFTPGHDSASWSLMSVGSVITRGGEVELPSLPMVRVMQEAPVYGNDLWRTRESLFGAPVYRRPQIESAPDGGSFQPLTGQPKVALTHGITLRIQCDPGEVGQLWVRDPKTVQVEELGAEFITQVTGGGTVQAKFAGPVEFHVSSATDATLPETPLACLDLSALAESSTAQEADYLEIHGSRITAEFSEPVTGVVTVATFMQPGWSCQMDGESADILDETGLLSIQVSGSKQLSCSFRTPGLRLGMGLSALALFALLAVAFAGRRRMKLAVGEGKGGDGVREGDGQDAADERSPGLGEVEPLDEDHSADGGESQIGEDAQGEREEPLPRRADAVGEPAVHEEREHH